MCLTMWMRIMLTRTCLLYTSIKKYTADMKAQVVAKDAKLKQVGYKQYLAEKQIGLSSIGGFL